MLEKMDTFFENRLEGYDEHMLNEIEGALEFYPFTAAALPANEGTRLLDLGCGTGLELEEYFPLCPTAQVTGIDLSRGMLSALEAKFPDKALTLRCESYFSASLDRDAFDAAVSVESLHHFTKDEKAALYRKVFESLVPGGVFVLTDYFSLTEEEEQFHRAELLSLRAEQGIRDDTFYHYDTPLTVDHETDALREGGFQTIDILKNWGATYTLRAVK